MLRKREYIEYIEVKILRYHKDSCRLEQNDIKLKLNGKSFVSNNFCFIRNHQKVHWLPFKVAGFYL